METRFKKIMLRMYMWLIRITINPIERMIVNMLLLLLIRSLFIPSEVHCEGNHEVEIITTEKMKELAISEVKVSFVREYHDLVRTPEWATRFKGRFYVEKMLDDSFIRAFADKFPWKTFLQEKTNLSLDQKFDIILKQFYNYALEEQKKYEYFIVQKMLYSMLPASADCWEYLLEQKRLPHGVEGRIVTQGSLELQRREFKLVMEKMVRLGFLITFENDKMKFYITNHWIPCLNLGEQDITNEIKDNVKYVAGLGLIFGMAVVVGYGISHLIIDVIFT